MQSSGKETGSSYWMLSSAFTDTGESTIGNLWLLWVLQLKEGVQNNCRGDKIGNLHKDMKELKIPFQSA